MPEIDHNRVAHLGMIQGVIARMAGNSLMIKSTAATISAAITALISSKIHFSGFLVFAAIVPIILCWQIDASYLRLEKLYRELYDRVRKMEDIDPFSMDFRFLDIKIKTLQNIAMSWSVFWFYLALAILVMAGFFVQQPWKD